MSVDYSGSNSVATFQLRPPDVSLRSFEDDQGRCWTVERIGRTSGIVTPKDGGGALPEPADIVRFVCQSDPDEPARETTMGAGLLTNSSDSDLLSSLQGARKLRRH